MANPQHLKWLQEGVEVWNAQRNLHRFKPVLNKADLCGEDLGAVDFRGADLIGADLSRAYLWGAKLNGADLSGADLRNADFRRADLRNADFRRADLGGADLRGADLRRADLGGADLRGENLDGAALREANLREANVRTTAGPTDFRRAIGLTQDQLETMNGDTGVLLPAGLHHPAHWPKWNEPEPEPVKPESALEPSTPLPPSRFIFLSYDSDDRAQIANLRTQLGAEEIPIWWDQNIQNGENWRKNIAQQLAAATVVLTVWTERSVQSDAVVEEASTAQTVHKLVHVRFDDAKLPYGFGETQYTDMSGWSGDRDDPRFRALVQTLRDRLNPPTREAKVERAAQAGPVTAVVQDGKIGIADTPPDGNPLINDPIELENRFEALEVSCQEYLAQRKELRFNAPDPIERLIERCEGYAATRKRNWYLWLSNAEFIEIRLKENQDFSWQGTNHVARSIVTQIRELQPYLKPQPVTPPPIPPEIHFGPQPEDKIERVVKQVDEIRSDAEAETVLTKDAQEFVADVVQDLREGLQRVSDPIPNAEMRFEFWRKAIAGLAGFAATVVKEIADNKITTGIAVVALTNPVAGQRLLSLLAQLRDMLLTFF